MFLRTTTWGKYIWKNELNRNMFSLKSRRNIYFHLVVYCSCATKTNGVMLDFISLLLKSPRTCKQMLLVTNDISPIKQIFCLHLLLHVLDITGYLKFPRCGKSVESNEKLCSLQHTNKLVRHFFLIKNTSSIIGNCFVNVPFLG